MIYAWIMNRSVAGLGETAEQAQERASQHSAKMHEVIFKHAGFDIEELKGTKLSSGYAVRIELLEAPPNEDPESVIRAQLEPVRFYQDAAP